jgi:hypothetical protein
MHGNQPGLVLDGETSAWPRGVALSLRPKDIATEEAMERVRRRLGWPGARAYDLQIERKGERLRLGGVDPEALPPGRYELDFRVSGLQWTRRFHSVRVPKGSQAMVTLEEKRPNRFVILDRPCADYDGGFKAILFHPRSELDGVPAPEWLENGCHRDRRKACLLNILAKLATVPAPADPLSRFVQSLFLADIDRVYCTVTPELASRLKQSRKFRRQKGSVHSTHRKLLVRLPDRGAKYELVSYREAAQPSLQITLAVPTAAESGSASANHYADIDIDLGNPTHDLAGLFIHIGEMLAPGPADHIKLRNTLAKRGMGEYLYYRVGKV